LSSPAFAGKDADGRPLLGHAHAYFLPADEDGDGRLDHLTVVAEAGFDPDDVAALDRLRRLPFAAASPVRLLLIALGGLADVRGGPLGESAVWSSATPFVATRYPKARGRKRDDWTCLSTPTDFAAHVLREELSRLRQRRPELPEVLGIEVLSASDSCHRPPSSTFQRRRSKAGDDGDRRSHGQYRVFFATPIRGPLSLGYASHFGLGLYLPDAGVGECG
jgi:CRISPR-associated protein Csb2